MYVRNRRLFWYALAKAGFSRLTPAYIPQKVRKDSAFARIPLNTSGGFPTNLSDLPPLLLLLLPPPGCPPPGGPPPPPWGNPPPPPPGLPPGFLPGPRKGPAGGDPPGGSFLSGPIARLMAISSAVIMVPVMGLIIPAGTVCVCVAITVVGGCAEM